MIEEHLFKLLAPIHIARRFIPSVLMSCYYSELDSVVVPWKTDFTMAVDGDMTNNFAEDLERFAEDPFIQAALSEGVDLRGYSRQIEEELREVEVESVRDYVSQSEQVIQLHQEMQSCDAILKRMQEMLLGFQVFSSFAGSLILPRTQGLPETPTQITGRFGWYFG
jgi:hypothetical protein